MSLFNELRRRNVFKVGAAYAITAWLLVQVADILFEAIGTPTWAMQTLLVFLGIGFFVALFFAWAFELTPGGIKRENSVDRTESITAQTGSKLNQAIVVLLAFALAYFIWESRFADRADESVVPQTTESVTPQAVSEDPPAAVTSTATPADDKSIAVLPFTHRSPDPNDTYFTDGVHDDLLTQLAKIGDLKVISRTSVLEYRDTTKNLKQVGEELGVAKIMEGAVQRSGDRVRINVQLIDADTDEHLWAETYDRQLTTDNLFDIQSEIARAIAGALKFTLTDEELASTHETPTESVEAYELYLRARSLSAYSVINENYSTAADLFEEALALDPQFKLAWAGLALNHMNIYWEEGGDPAERDAARAAIEQATALDPDFPELHQALGAYYYWGFLDYDQALAHFDQALSAMPGNAETHMLRGYVLRRSGNWEAAVTAMRESLRLDPRVFYNWIELGQTLQILRRFDEARSVLNQARALNGDHYWINWQLALILIEESGDVETAMNLTHGDRYTDQLLWFDGYLFIRTLGRRHDEALEALERTPAEFEIQRNFIRPVEILIADQLRYLGRTEDARNAALIGLERLDRMAQDLSEDQRDDRTRALVMALLGKPGDQVTAAIEAGIKNAPVDALDNMYDALEYARIAAIAGLVEYTIRLLEPLLKAPIGPTVHSIDLDPAFDGIREHSDFVAMMERYR